MKYLPALEALADVIRDAGIRATLDTNTINAPGVLVTPGALTLETLTGATHATAYVAIVAPALDETHAYAVLDTMLAPVVTALEAAGYPITAGEPVTIGGSPTTGTPLPAIRLTTEIYLGD